MPEKSVDLTLTDLDIPSYVSDEITGVSVSIPESFLGRAASIAGALAAAGMHHAVVREGTGIKAEFNSPTGPPELLDVSDQLEISVSATGNIHGVANWAVSNEDVGFQIGNIQNLYDLLVLNEGQQATKPKMGM